MHDQPESKAESPLFQYVFSDKSHVAESNSELNELAYSKMHQESYGALETRMQNPALASGFRDNSSALKQAESTGERLIAQRSSGSWSYWDYVGKPKVTSKPNDHPAESKRHFDPREFSKRSVIEVRPGNSIQRAIEQAKSGEIIHVHPGVYREQLSITRDNITLKGDRAVLDLEGKQISGAAIHIRDRHNVTIDGFEIRNVRGRDTPTGILVDGASRDITLRNNNIHHVESNTNAHGIGVFGDRKTPIRNMLIQGNKVHHLKLGQSESVAVNGNVEGFSIIGNRIHDNDNIGIDVIGYEGVGPDGLDRARNGVIANNVVSNIDSRTNPTYRKASAAGIYVDGGMDIRIENNVVRRCNYGIELASEHRGKYTEGIQIRRNRVKESDLAGITVGGSSRSNGGVADSKIENNDLSLNRRKLWLQHNVKPSVVFRNNH